ncbi:hypothetical protein Q0V21_18905 [Paenibacillus sp. 11B]|uniref:hypothetical protein n=1 Tax=Bacillales TaxID=1385 RepID=UPI00264DB9FE|nr:hypothetical protein [Paenibacillus sp. 11B]MDN8590829.1 hypothetical protein [Paenibacillus sp. 11B]
MSVQATSEWICDKCGNPIEEARLGWFEWYSDSEDVQTGFRIVHHDQKCMYNETQLFQEGKSLKDMHLDHFTSPEGLLHLLEILERPGVKDKSEVSELIKRIHVPGYENERFED